MQTSMNKFTKKHYILIANTIKKIDNNETRKIVFNLFVDMLEDDNDKFDYGKFLQACRVVQCQHHTTSIKDFGRCLDCGKIVK